VALVASAAKGLCTKICKDRTTGVLCTLSAAIAYYYQAAWLFPTIIAVGGLVSYVQKRNDDVTPKVGAGANTLFTGRHWAGGPCASRWRGDPMCGEPKTAGFDRIGCEAAVVVVKPTARRMTMREW
jgi:hypothetical protein